MFHLSDNVDRHSNDSWNLSHLNARFIPQNSKLTSSEMIEKVMKGAQKLSQM